MTDKKKRGQTPFSNEKKLGQTPFSDEVAEVRGRAGKKGSDPARFEHHVRTVSLLTLFSRITGLARDAALSRVFGAGPLMDSFFFAFMIPNLFRRLFGEGALAAAFLPAFARLDREDPAAARKLASLTVALLVVVLGAAVLAAEVALYAISARTDHSNLAIWLTMVMLPYAPMVCVVAILGAMLQVYHRFGPTAAAPMVLNLCVTAVTILGAVILGNGSAEAIDSAETRRLAHIGSVAASVLVAGVIQFAWALVSLRGHEWWTRALRGAAPELRRVLRQALPMILGLGVLQINTLIDGVIASWPVAVGPTIFGIDYPLEEGAMSAVSFASRLYQFPLGVFGIAVATAIFPALAREGANGAAFNGIVERGLRLVIFIGLPASVGLALVREPLTIAVLQGGDFSLDDASRVARVLLGYGTAVWAYSMTHVLARAFYAREEAFAPVRVALAMVGLNFVLNVVLIWTPLREAGLAWATAFCAMVQAVLLLVLLSRRTGGLVTRAVRMSWTKSAIASVLMAVAVAAVSLGLPATYVWSHALLNLAILVTTGGGMFVLAAFVLRMEEPRMLLTKSARSS